MRDVDHVPPPGPPPKRLPDRRPPRRPRPRSAGVPPDTAAPEIPPEMPAAPAEDADRARRIDIRV